MNNILKKNFLERKRWNVVNLIGVALVGVIRSSSGKMINTFNKFHMNAFKSSSYENTSTQCNKAELISKFYKSFLILTDGCFRLY